MSREEKLEALLREILAWLQAEATATCAFNGKAWMARTGEALDPPPFDRSASLPRVPPVGMNCNIELRTGEKVRANWEDPLWASCDGTYRTFKNEELTGWSLYGG